MMSNDHPQLDNALTRLLSRQEKRAALQNTLWERYQMSDDHPAILRFVGQDSFTFIHPSELLRFLSFDALIECLTNHQPEIFKLLYREVNLDREGAALQPDEEGTSWLVLDDIGVDLGANNADHAVSPVVPSDDAAIGVGAQ
jgi:hypothetical protein